MNQKNWQWKNINATRIVVVAFAMLYEFTGITAGYFEILQGKGASGKSVVQ